ncbi:uncharacterized protein LOC128496920 [Spea bombifrons]|uniref:uncharacterized protein LOC128496920 n=1 Tax=Spea bombifrons TaxID=233779 RepID=UPI002349A1A4|nr:uncharacterized protein LOC128496920 [Spea bombifrons]
MYLKNRPPEKKSQYAHVCEICKIGCTSAIQLDEHFKGMKHRLREDLITSSGDPLTRKRSRSSSKSSDLQYSSYKDYNSYPDHARSSEHASSSFDKSPRRSLSRHSYTDRHLWKKRKISSRDELIGDEDKSPRRSLSSRHSYTGRSTWKKRKISSKDKRIRDEEHRFQKQSKSPTHSDDTHRAKEEPEDEYSAIPASCDSSESEDSPCGPGPEKKKRPEEDINKAEICLPEDSDGDEDYKMSLLPLQSKEEVLLFLKNFEIADNSDVEFLTNVTQFFSKAVKMYWTDAHGNKEHNKADLITEKESSRGQTYDVNTEVDNPLTENEIMGCLTAEAASSDDEG